MLAEPPQADLIRALIQAAAAMHKVVVQDNRRGALILLDRALDRLAAVRDGELGVAWEPFAAELAGWRSRLVRGEVAPQGSIVGLPHLEWSADGTADRLDVDVVRLYEVDHAGTRAILVSVGVAGIEGWGECRLSWGRFGQWDSLVSLLAPALLADAVAAPTELGVRWSEMGGDPCAAAALEGAVWDVWARREGLPLTVALGLTPRAVPLAGCVPAGDAQRVGELLAERLCLGYRHIILPARPNADRRVLPALVSDCPVACSIDLGEAYRAADYEALRSLDASGATWLSRPVPRADLGEAVRLARRLETPVSLGGWVRPVSLQGALELGACDVAHVDPGRSGLGAGLDMIEMAASRHVAVWVASPAVTAIGAQSALALAAHPSVRLAADLWHGDQLPAQPMVAPDADGCAPPSPGPGLGIVPDPGWLAAAATRRSELRA